MITLFHDYGSPASAVAVLRLHALLDEGLAVTFAGYQPLPIEVPVPPTLQILEELERHREGARALGLILRRPRRVPPTTGAHLVEQLLDDPTRARRFRDAAYRSLWEDGRDLASVDVLVTLAVEVGCDGDAARARLQDRAAFARVKQRLAQPRAAHVGDVPALSVDGTLVSPFVPLDDLRHLATL